MSVGAVSVGRLSILVSLEKLSEKEKVAKLATSAMSPGMSHNDLCYTITGVTEDVTCEKHR